MTPADYSIVSGDRQSLLAAADTHRALGEAVMLAMVSGSVAFSPNPADGLIFIYEPSLPLAPASIMGLR